MCIYIYIYIYIYITGRLILLYFLCDIIKLVDRYLKNVDHFEFVTSSVLREKFFLESGIELKYFQIPFI